MHPFPHHYPASAAATRDSNVTLTTAGVADLESAGPVEFGGPGDLWSPEALLSASVADCFVLSFRAISRASRLDWIDLECHVNGELDRVDGQTRFTGFEVNAKLTVPAGTNLTKAESLLHKAEKTCLITNSLIAASTLKTEIAIQ